MNTLARRFASKLLLQRKATFFTIETLSRQIQQRNNSMIFRRMAMFSTGPLNESSNQVQSQGESAENQTEKTQDNTTYTFDAESIKGVRRNVKGLLMIMFTCNICNQRMGRTFSKDAYENGVVLIRCESCDNLHLIADNLGWFRDNKVNIEQIAQETGKKLYRFVSKETMEFIVSDKAPDQINQEDEQDDHSGCCGGHGHHHHHATEKADEGGCCGGSHDHHHHQHEGGCCDHSDHKHENNHDENGCCGGHDHDQKK